MKKSLFKIMIKTLFTAAILPTFTGCSKSPQCETWEVSDEGFSTGRCIFTLGCNGSRSLNLVFCGDGLKVAKEGNTIILSDDSCCRQTRTFVRRIK